MSKQPTTWEDALENAGLVDPRNGRPSFNQLAIRAGMAPSTITAIVNGRSKPSPVTIQKIADALRVDVRLVGHWVGQARTERAPYSPPAEADLLTHRQRRAVDEMIRSIVADRESTDEPDESTPVPDSTVRDGSTTARADWGLAASKGRSKLAALDADAARAGEESQDPSDYR